MISHDLLKTMPPSLNLVQLQLPQQGLPGGRDLKQRIKGTGLDARTPCLSLRCCCLSTAWAAKPTEDTVLEHIKERRASGVTDHAGPTPVEPHTNLLTCAGWVGRDAIETGYPTRAQRAVDCPPNARP